MPTTPSRPSRTATRRRGSDRRVSPRRFAVLAVVCAALVLTVAVPLRTFVAQRQELNATLAQQEVSRQEVESLTAQRERLSDPTYVERSARDRLRYVMPGETPFQVQLPDDVSRRTDEAASTPPPPGPWYSELWGSITAPAP